MSSGLMEAPSMKELLPEVVDDFSRALNDRPDNALMSADRAGTIAEFDDYDWFGEFNRGVTKLFMQTARNRLSDHSDAAVDQLMPKMALAHNGIGIIALYSEIVPLVLMDERPEEPVSSEQAGEVTRNGYDFLEDIILSGDPIGASLVRKYLLQEEGRIKPWVFDGTIIGRHLVRPIRLTRFRADSSSDGQTAVIPRDFQSTKEYFAQNLSGGYKRVTCPAQLYRDPQTDLTLARSLFDVLVDYSEEYIYPYYIPLASDVLKTAQRDD